MSLAPGETKAVTFTLGRAELERYDRERKWTVEPGRFTAMLGASSEDIRLYGTFVIAAPNGTAPEEAPIDNSKFDPR